MRILVKIKENNLSVIAINKPFFKIIREQLSTTISQSRWASAFEMGFRKSLALRRKAIKNFRIVDEDEFQILSYNADIIVMSNNQREKLENAGWQNIENEADFDDLKYCHAMNNNSGYFDA